MDEQTTPNPLEALRLSLAAVRDNARYAADPRELARLMADAWCDYFNATQPAAAPATEAGGA